MPVLLHQHLYEPGEWGLWEITESEEELSTGLELFPAEAEQLSCIRGTGRRREFLAARKLLHHMSGRDVRGELYKDDAGKPHLRSSHFHVSISHTGGYAAAAAHPNPCGIDVQRIVPRIHRLAHKFVSPAEEAQLRDATRLEQLHLIWSAKEALYKAYGRRQLDFKENLYVDFGTYQPGQTAAEAMLRRGEIQMLFDVEMRTFDNFVLVACVERTPPPPHRESKGSTSDL